MIAPFCWWEKHCSSFGYLPHTCVLKNYWVFGENLCRRLGFSSFWYSVPWTDFLRIWPSSLEFRDSIELCITSMTLTSASLQAGNWSSFSICKLFTPYLKYFCSSLADIQWLQNYSFLYLDFLSPFLLLFLVVALSGLCYFIFIRNESLFHFLYSFQFCSPLSI